MREQSTAARGMLVLSIAGILSKVISVVYNPFLIEILGSEGFGIYSTSTDIFLFFYAITSMGAQPAVTKVVSELTALENHKGAVRALQLSRKIYMILGGALGIIMIFIAKPYANLSASPEAAYGIIALAPCVFLTCVLATYRGYMQGKNNMTAIAVSQILEQLFNVVISLFCAYILMNTLSDGNLSYGAAGGQIGTSVGALIAILFLIYVFYKRKYKENALLETQSGRRVSDKKIIRKILVYSIPITISAGLQNFGGIIDSVNVKNRLITAGFIGRQNELYGWLGMYKTLYSVPLIVITAIGTTVLPAITRLIVLNDRKGVKKKTSHAFRLTFLIAIPSAVGLSILSKYVYLSLYNKTDGYQLMQFGSFVLVLAAMTQIQTVILQGLNKLYYVLATFGAGILVKVIVNYIFVGITDINIYGAIIGNFFWLIIPAIYNHKKICRTLKIRMPIIKITIKPVIASTAMGIVLFILKIPADYLYGFIGERRLTAFPITIVLVGIGTLVYAYLIILMGGVTRKDIQGVSPKLMRIMPKFMRAKLR